MKNRNITLIEEEMANIFEERVRSEYLLFKVPIPLWIVENSKEIYRDIYNHPPGSAIVFDRIVQKYFKNNKQKRVLELREYLTKYLTGSTGIIDMKFINDNGQELTRIIKKFEIVYMLDKKIYKGDDTWTIFVRNERNDMTQENKLKVVPIFDI